MVVIDCSVAVALVMPDEHSPYAARVFEYMDRNTLLPVVPKLFQCEVVNALLMSERRKRISEAQFHDFADYWLQAPLEEDLQGNINAIIALAKKHRLTVYDAAYLELAIRRKAKLATLDSALQKAAKKEKVAFRGK